MFLSSSQRIETPVLQHLSLGIAAGQRVALVGASGSGKSTIFSLLERFYDVDAGAVLFDGRDIREYDLWSLRTKIAVVSQVRC